MNLPYTGGVPQASFIYTTAMPIWEKIRTCEISGKALWGIALLLFIIASALHIYWGSFPKSIDVMPDEMRYLDTARSLFAGDGLILRGEASTFQKILYPLAIMPALALTSDAQMQIQIIGILNSLYACSTVFPMLVLARKLTNKAFPLVASMVVSLLLPDLMYSMTFMTESLFVPLTLWLVALCWRTFESTGVKEARLALFAGLFTYAVYLCKEVALMFVIAFVAWYVVAAIRGRRDRTQAIIVAGMFVVGFIVPFVVMKMTLFSGMMNSYSQFSFDILESAYTVCFGLYALATDATYFVIGFGVFPILFLLFIYHDMPQRERDLAFFCLVSLLVGLAVVVFTISMREDVGHVALRQHLRYVIPLFLPLLLLFAKHAFSFNPLPVLRNARRRAFVAGTTAAFCVLCVAFFGSANLSQGFDNSEFHFMRYTLELSEELEQEYHDSWTDTMSAISTDDGDLLVIDPVNWLWRAGVIVFVAVGMRYLFDRRPHTRRVASGAICGVIVFFMIANSVCAYGYNMKAYTADQSDIDQVCALDTQLASLSDGGQIAIVLDSGNTKNNNLIDSYIRDGEGKYDYLTLSGLQSRLESDADAGTEAAATSAVAEPIRYLLVNRDTHFEVVSGTIVAISQAADGDGRYILYEVTGTEPLKIRTTSEG